MGYLLEWASLLNWESGRLLVMIRGLLARLQRGQSASEVTLVLDSASVALGQDSAPSCRLLLTHYHFHMNLQKKTFLETLEQRNNAERYVFPGWHECCNNIRVSGPAVWFVASVQRSQCNIPEKLSAIEWHLARRRLASCRTCWTLLAANSKSFNIKELLILHDKRCRHRASFGGIIKSLSLPTFLLSKQGHSGFKLFIFNWRIIALQYSVGFCQMSTWISHGYTSLLNLPPHPSPLVCYRVPVWVSWVIQQISKFMLAILHMVIYVSTLFSLDIPPFLTTPLPPCCVHKSVL